MKKYLTILLFSFLLIMFSFAYAFVPLYKIFCILTSYGGYIDNQQNNAITNLSKRSLTIKFQSTVAEGLPWTFKPLQNDLNVLVGEAALSFYQAHNLANEKTIGVATYNVTPAKAGLYFNKIQCFCFEEQILYENQTIDMPVFFYIDPDLLKDPLMEEVSTIILSYTFFRTS